VGPKKHVLDWVQSLHTKGQLLGESTCPGMPDDTVVSCAKMAEPIDLPFRLLYRVGRRKHKRNRIRQDAPICPHWRTHWRHLANTTESCFCGGDAALCQITLTTCYHYY